MPGQALPPSRQHFQPWASLPLARSGYGSLNRSNTTALLPLNQRATDAQKRTAPASGIGFWQTACADEHPDDGPA
jgi:hypothetical protein